LTTFILLQDFKHKTKGCDGSYYGTPIMNAPLHLAIANYRS
jgi:hypothetical protein